MLSNECWLAFHDYCELLGWCDCLCHAQLDELIEEVSGGIS